MVLRHRLPTKLLPPENSSPGRAAKVQFPFFPRARALLRAGGRRFRGRDAVGNMFSRPGTSVRGPDLRRGEDGRSRAAHCWGTGAILVRKGDPRRDAKNGGPAAVSSFWRWPHESGCAWAGGAHTRFEFRAALSRRGTGRNLRYFLRRFSARNVFRRPTEGVLTHTRPPSPPPSFFHEPVDSAEAGTLGRCSANRGLLLCLAPRRQGGAGTAGPRMGGAGSVDEPRRHRWGLDSALVCIRDNRRHAVLMGGSTRARFGAERWHIDDSWPPVRDADVAFRGGGGGSGGPAGQNRFRQILPGEGLSVTGFGLREGRHDPPIPPAPGAGSLFRRIGSVELPIERQGDLADAFAPDGAEPSSSGPWAGGGPEGAATNGPFGVEPDRCPRRLDATSGRPNQGRAAGRADLATGGRFIPGRRFRAGPRPKKPRTEDESRSSVLRLNEAGQGKVRSRRGRGHGARLRVSGSRPRVGDTGRQNGY